MKFAAFIFLKLSVTLFITPKLLPLLFRFWLAVQEVKKRPIREVPTRVQEIWQEFLAPGAPSAINVDSKSYGKTTQNIKDPGRYAFEDAQVSYHTVANDKLLYLMLVLKLLLKKYASFLWNLEYLWS